MRIHESAENYLESILTITREKGSVRAIDIVNDLGFSKPSVSVAMKNLEAAGYIERDAAGHISLLPPGKEIAEKIYERHTTLVALLTKLGVSPEVADKDACEIEHHLSEETFNAIKEHVNDIL